VADLSSTGTSSSFTPDAQPLNSATSNALAKKCFVMIYLVN
jgi:hypothetical protein